MRAAASLNAIGRQALNDALDDEYKSHAAYRGVITGHGPIRPFINTAETEARRIGRCSPRMTSCWQACGDPIFWKSAMRYEKPRWTGICRLSSVARGNRCDRVKTRTLALLRKNHPNSCIEY